MPETKVGAIVAELKLNSSKFSRGIVKSEKSMKGLQSTFKRIGGSLIALAGIGGLGLFAKSTLDAADKIGKMSDRIGITTTELQQMKFAFNLAGVSEENMSKGLLVFGKRLGKARQGIGALEGGLKGGQEALLKTIKSTNSTSEALNVVFNAMGKAKNQAEKLAIADAAFGTVGLNMTAAFKDGAKAFFEAKQEAIDLGVVIDEKLIRNAEQLNDQFTRVSGLMKTQLQAAFLELVPAISIALGWLIDFVQELREIEKINEALSIDSLQNRFGRLSEDLQEANNKLERLNKSLKKAQSADLLFGKDEVVNNLKDQIQEQEKIIEQKKKILDLTIKAINRNRKLGIGAKPKKPEVPDNSGKSSVDESKLQLDQVLRNGKKFADVVRDLQKARKVAVEALQEGILLGPKAKDIEQMEMFKDAVEGITFLQTQFDDSGFFLVPSEDDIKKMEEAERLVKNQIIANEEIRLGLMNVGQVFDSTTESGKRLEKESELMEEALKFFKDPLDDLVEMQIAIQAVGRSMNLSSVEIEEALKRSEEAFGLAEDKISDWEQQMLDSIEAIRSGLESNLTDAFQNMINGTENFKEAFVDILLAIQKEIIRTFIVAQLLKAIGNAFSFGAGGAVSAGPSAAIGATQAVGLALQPFADGGRTPSTGSFLVGEKGPEVLSFGSSAHVTPNDELGGGGQQIVLQVSTGVQSTVKAELIQLLPKIQETVKAGIADARLRGGQFSRAMGV